MLFVCVNFLKCKRRFDATVRRDLDALVLKQSSLNLIQALLEHLPQPKQRLGPDHPDISLDTH